MLYFAYSFITDHITVDNYYLLLLYKTKVYNIKWEIANFVLKTVRVIISRTIKLEDFDLNNTLVDNKPHIFFLTILQKSMLILMILYLQKKD